MTRGGNRTQNLPLCPCCGKRHIKQKYAKQCAICKREEKRRKKDIKATIDLIKWERKKLGKTSNKR